MYHLEETGGKRNLLSYAKLTLLRWFTCETPLVFFYRYTADGIVSGRRENRGFYHSHIRCMIGEGAYWILMQPRQCVPSVGFISGKPSPSQYETKGDRGVKVSSLAAISGLVHEGSRHWDHVPTISSYERPITSFLPGTSLRYADVE